MSSSPRVLVACEYSGRVRDAFLRRGFDAVSCDLLPTDAPGPHYQGDVLDILGDGWDLMVAHPPCTYLTGSAAWAFKDGPYHQKVKPGTLVGQARRDAREQDLLFVARLASAPIPRIAIENPARGFLNTMLDLTQYGFRSNFPTQVVKPHQYGHDASKDTGLALKGLPDLVPTKIIAPRYVDGHPRWGNQTDGGQNRLPPTDDRWKIRSETYHGIADAMASQWGPLLRGTLTGLEYDDDTGL